MANDFTLNPTTGTATAGSTAISQVDSGNQSLTLTADATQDTSAGSIASGNQSLSLATGGAGNNLTQAQATAWASNAVSSATSAAARSSQYSSAGAAFARTPNNNSITSIPDLADINITSKLSRLSDSTTYFSVVPAGGTPEDVISTKEVEAAITYRNSFKSGAPLTEYVNFFQSIESKYFGGTSALFYNGGQFSNDSILFWVKKYFALPELSKFRNATSAFYRQAWSSANYSQIHLKFILEKYAADTQSFFGSFSDSIGLLANSKYHQLDSTQPIFDITQQNYGVPIPFTANMENKVGPTARNLMYNLSKLTTASMRRNLMHLAYYNAAYKQNFKVSSRVPHACNLVNDIAFFVEFAQEAEQRMNLVKTKFTSFGGRLWNFIQYISNIGNRCAVNLRDIYAPIDGYDKDFVVTPGTTDIAVNSLDQSSIDRQIGEINNFAIADATIARNLYANTAGADGDFYGQNFISKNITFRNNRWTNNYNDTGRATPSIEGQEVGPYLGNLPGSLNPDDDDYLPPVVSPNSSVDTPPVYDKNGNLIIDASNVTDILNKNVSVYGNAESDLTTYFDLNTEARKQYTQGWLDKGYTIERLNAIEADLVSRGIKPGTLKYEYQFSGPGGKLIENFSIGVKQTDRSLVGRYVQIIDTTTNKPVGAAFGNSQGIYHITDTGSSALGNKVDFYYGSNEALKNYFTSLAGNNPATNQPRLEIRLLDVSGKIPNTGSSSGGVTAGNSSLAGSLFRVDSSESGSSGRVTEPYGGADSDLPSPMDMTYEREESYSSFTSPQVQTEEATADAVASLPSDTETIQLADKVPQPVFNGSEVTSDQKNAAVAASTGASSRPYSNRQRMFPFSFLIRGEDIDGESIFIEVDYLLKKIVSDNFNPYTRIDILASGVEASLISGVRSDGTQGQTLADYARLLSRADLKNLFSSGNADLILETLGISPSTSGATGQLYNQLKSILNQKSLTSNTLSQGYQSFISMVSQRLPTDLMATITNNSAIYDQFAGQLNSISGGILPTTGDIFDSLNPFNYIDINIQGIIPSVSLGSLADFIGIASELGTSGPPKSISQAYNLAKEINDIVCNFQLPFIDWPIVEELIKMKFKPSEIGKAIKDEFEKIVDRLGDLFDPAKIYEQIKVSVENFFKQVYKDLFTCDEKDKQNKSGQEFDSSINR